MPVLSVIEPVPLALQRTRRLLFEPFQLRRWLRLGFCAFLMGSAPTGLFGGGPNLRLDAGGGSVLQETLMTWMEQHLTLLLILGLAGLALVALLTLLGTWLSSRGRFMLLHGVIHNRGAIAAPWQEYRREANSLFRFRVGIGLISLALLALILSGVVVLILPDLQAGVVSLRLVASLLAGLLLLLAWLLVMHVIAVLLLDFVAPVMLQRRLTVLRAWPIVIDGLVRQQPWGFVLYLLARTLLDGVLGALSLLAIVLSCCLALVPYLGAVLLLPLTVFHLSYALAYLEQLGPAWQMSVGERSAAPGS